LLALPQHADEHRPERPILLAVDQQFCEGATLRVAPELADPIGSLEVGEHQDVEKLGAGSGAERVEACLETALEFVGAHGRRLRDGGAMHKGAGHTLGHSRTVLPGSKSSRPFPL